MVYSMNHKPWDEIKRSYESWWTNCLERPLFNIQILVENSSVPKPSGSIKNKFSDYDFNIPVDDIIKHVAYRLSNAKYLGDSYPTYLPDFGAGVNAAFVGAKHIVRPESVWFEPEKSKNIEDVVLQHNPDNVVYSRIAEFYMKADKYFKGRVVLGMTHLNNGIDIPARLNNSTDFCIALYDHPKEVERLVWENHNLFYFYLDELSSMMPHNQGFTCSGNILANDPWMGLQSDFSALIGPDHFQRFVLPELRACTLHHPKYNFYHVDGREELVHLDRILDIPDLQVIQWQRGDNELPDEEWMWLYKKIRNAGKKLWYCGPSQNLDLLADTLGSLKGVYWQAIGKEADEDHYYKIMEKYSVS